MNRKKMSELILCAFTLFILTIPVTVIGTHHVNQLRTCVKNQNLIAKQDSQIEDIIQQINESTIYGHIKTIQDFGPHPTESEACDNVRDYIYHKFQEMDLNVIFYDWKRGSYQGENIIATLQGANTSSESVFIVSAHYDSAPVSPGADDDGSGVSAVLAAAQALSQYELENTICFITFSGEEQGTLGSLSYAKDLYQNGETISGIINLDGIGHIESPGGAKKVIIYEEEVSTWITDVAVDVANEFFGEIDIKVERLPNMGYSDHNSFLAYGYEAIEVEEYDYNDKFHTPNDTLEFVNITYATKITKLVAGTLAKLADMPERDPVITIEYPLRGRLYIFDKQVMPLDKGKVIVFGKIHFTVTTRTSASKVQKVDFYLDDNLKFTDTEEPFEWVCRRPLLWRREVKVIMYDDLGGTDVDQMDIGFFIYT